VEEHDPNSGNRVSEVECLRERIKALEAENDQLKIRSAFMKVRLDEIEAQLRAADPTCSNHEVTEEDDDPTRPS
jgi:regulator of replication initiation timing